MQVFGFSEARESEARESFRAVLDRVEADADVALITRRYAKGAVVMSLDTYNSLMETVHLLRSPANAAHLQRPLEQAGRGELLPHGLIDCRSMAAWSLPPLVDCCCNRARPALTTSLWMRPMLWQRWLSMARYRHRGAELVRMAPSETTYAHITALQWLSAGGLDDALIASGNECRLRSLIIPIAALSVEKHDEHQAPPQQ
jgi:antitoxin YefM